ncbi:MAG: LPS export ABC transporter periplasmic protein LptC [Bacteroidales bacterium]|nr:LPS export ABC transporter periplasmic protein LptC [Bacteroidales bacterium]
MFGNLRHIAESAAARLWVAAAFALLVACSTKTEVTDQIDISAAPRQVGDSILAIQSVNGEQSLRVEAPRMEKYEFDTLSYELFPAGFDVFSYKDGNLETSIRAKKARHTVHKDKSETWEVFGNVVITNYINGQVLKTDTLYWDRYEHKIFTNCYVEMSSPQGFMQGYGMESDEQARNAEILRPFDSFTRIAEDSLYVDTANFIGPILDPAKINADLKVKGKDGK